MLDGYFLLFTKCLSAVGADIARACIVLINSIVAAIPDRMWIIGKFHHLSAVVDHNGFFAWRASIIEIIPQKPYGVANGAICKERDNDDRKDDEEKDKGERRNKGKDQFRSDGEKDRRYDRAFFSDEVAQEKEGEDLCGDRRRHENPCPKDDLIRFDRKREAIDHLDF